MIFATFLRWLRDKWLLLLAIALVAGVAGRVAWRLPSDTTVWPPPVQQTRIVEESIEYQGKKGPLTMRLLADFRVTAVVKSRQFYVSDTASQVSPMDLVLAWGDMNQAEIDPLVSYSQSNRWYYIRYRDHLPVPASYLTENTANVHLIPADTGIEVQLRRIRVGDRVTLEGYLVQVEFAEGTWTSSLSRSDSGDGACEILYVNRVRRGGDTT